MRVLSRQEFLAGVRKYATTKFDPQQSWERYLPMILMQKRNREERKAYKRIPVATEDLSRRQATARAIRIFQREVKTFDEAFLLYQKVVAEKGRSLKVSKFTPRRHRWPDRNPVIPCPLCRGPMILETVCTPKGPENIFGWKARWFCHSCFAEKYSKRTMKNWKRKLRRDDVSCRKGWTYA